MNSPIPKRITRQLLFDLRNTTNFVYGDTYHRDGKPGGQATEARGALNAYPIMVKLRACANDPGSFLSDKMFAENMAIMERQLSMVPKDQPVIVFPKIGLGWNKMPEKAPQTYRAMRDLLLAALGSSIVNPEDI